MQSNVIFNWSYVSGGGRWFNVSLQCNPFSGVHMFSNRPWDTKHSFRTANIILNCHRGKATCLSVEPYTGPCSQPLSESRPLVKEVKATCQNLNVVSLNSEECMNEDLSGGKGCSLAVMLHSHIPDAHIPSGVCLTTSAYKLQLQKNEDLAKQVTLVEKAAWNLCSESKPEQQAILKTTLEEECNRAVVAIQSSKLDPTIASDLTQQLCQVFNDQDWEDMRFAVRSSAVGEDTEDLSAAGQNETFLGCKGSPRIQEAIVQCWASLYSFQSVEYRRQNGQEISVPMAVVVQQMVDADSAGVLFSRDPVTGDQSQIVITVNFGLGESVVSASAEPDTIVVENKFWEERDNVTVRSRRAGAKKIKVVLSEQGTVTQNVDSDEAASMCLSDSMAIKLATLAIDMEQRFGGPRDIEFAIKEDKIYLLQSRPITSLSTWTDYELLHELDTAVSSSKDIVSKANLGEVVPGASTVLTISTICKALDVSLQGRSQSSPANQQQYCGYIMKIMPITHHHIVFNYIDCILQYLDCKNVSKPLVGVDMAVFGHPVTTQEAVNTALERRKMVTGLPWYLNLAFTLKSMFKCYRWYRSGLPEHFVACRLDDRIYTMSTLELYQHITQVVGHEYIEHMKIHGQVSEASSTVSVILFITMMEDSEDWDADLCCDLAELMVCDDDDIDVVSADVPSDLKKLSQTIYEGNDAQAFIEMSPQDADKWLRNTVRVSALYRAFLEKFGHRCLREFELESIPWKEDTKPLVDTLQAMVASLLASKVTKARNVTMSSLESKIDAIKRPLKAKTKKSLKFFLPFAYAFVSLREASKSKIIQRSHEARVAYRQLAKLLCNEGRLPDPQLIFHLTHYEIGQLINNRDPVLIQKATRRRRLRATTWDDLRFPEMIYGTPKPMEQNVSGEEKGDEAVVSGTPVCRGKYRGIGRVVTRVADAHIIRQGDVLITISTDIGWSPYFPLLGGVVTELGGLISHGAVVAREYGLPCVVGAEGATAVFQSGDVVEIDGGKGTVTKCSV